MRYTIDVYFRWSRKLMDLLIDGICRETMAVSRSEN